MFYVTYSKGGSIKKHPVLLQVSDSEGNEKGPTQTVIRKLQAITFLMCSIMSSRKVIKGEKKTTRF